MSNWELAVPWILSAEGRHSSDPGGGDTWWGVARAYHLSETPWPPTKDRALEILKTGYWEKCHCGELPMPLALGLFDCAVNQGPHWAVETFQRSLRMDEADVDGRMGPVTIRTAKRATDPVETAIRFLSYRAQRYCQQSRETDRLGLCARLFRLILYVRGREAVPSTWNTL